MSKKIVFIAGPRKISKLSKKVIEKLDSLQSKEFQILIGDANGVDKAVQNYIYKNNYSNVNVYATEGKARNNIGKWTVVPVSSERKTKDFKYYTAKDIEMAKTADLGFMIWNGNSKGTLRNTIQLLSMNKEVVMYYSPLKKIILLKTLDDLNILIKNNCIDILEMYDELLINVKKDSMAQLSFNDIG